MAGAPFTLSGFADEISQEPAEQIAGLKASGVSRIEVRGVAGRNSLDLSDAELDAYRAQLEDAGIRVAALGSPAGKSDVTAPAEAAFDRCRRAVEVAQRLGELADQRDNRGLFVDTIQPVGRRPTLACCPVEIAVVVEAHPLHVLHLLAVEPGRGFALDTLQFADEGLAAFHLATLKHPQKRTGGVVGSLVDNVE